MVLCLYFRLILLLFSPFRETAFSQTGSMLTVNKKFLLNMIIDYSIYRSNFDKHPFGFWLRKLVSCYQENEKMHRIRNSLEWHQKTTPKINFGCAIISIMIYSISLLSYGMSDRFAYRRLTWILEEKYATIFGSRHLRGAL